MNGADKLCRLFILRRKLVGLGGREGREGEREREGEKEKGKR